MNMSTERIKNLKEKIINKCKDLNKKIIKKIEAQNDVLIFYFQELIQNTIENDKLFNKLTIKFDEMNSHIKENKETINNLELEKCLILTIIKEKELQIAQKETALRKLQSDIINIDYMLKKESDNLDRAKYDRENLNKNDTILLNELKDFLSIFKSISFLAFEKTSQGLFKIILKNIIIDGKNGYIILSVAGRKYKIIEIFPEFPCPKLIEEFEKSHNLTIFISKIIKEIYSNQIIKK